MKKNLLIILFFTVPFVSKAYFDFFGSAVYIETNGSSSFYNCNGSNIGTNTFSGSLGSFAQNSGLLKLQGAEMKTWKNTWSNVCEPIFNYRIYPSGSPSGSFTSVNLPWFCDCEGTTFPSSCGFGNCSNAGTDQKWQKPGNTGSGLNIDLTTYAAGTYTIEVYYQVPGNDNGTTGCPDSRWDNNSNNPTNYTMSFTITSTLPLELTSLSAILIDNDVEVQWSSVSEKGIDSYEIQRSSDGQNFFSIGDILSKKIQSGISNYQYSDKKPDQYSTNYYRLKIKEINGGISYSKMVLVNLAVADKFVVSPTIAQDRINCIYTQSNKEGKIIIYNLIGKEIKNIHVSKNSSETSIGISDLSAGQYLITYDTGSNKIIKRFFKTN